jgi:protein MpaA
MARARPLNGHRSLGAIGVVAVSLAAATAVAACGSTDKRHSAPRRPPSRAAARPLRAGTAQPALRRTSLLGRSVRGRAIRLTEIVGGAGGRTVLVVGCIHGTECAGEAVTALLGSGPSPRRGRILVVSDLNPDGHAAGIRTNARGVDLNRNFPGGWQPRWLPGDPQYSGPRPSSEPETRIAERLILRERPAVTVWFHQPQGWVRAWGHSIPEAQRYATLAGARFRRLRWPTGTAPNWQNHRFRDAASFVVELGPGPLSGSAASRYARAARILASG